MFWTRTVEIADTQDTDLRKRQQKAMKDWKAFDKKRTATICREIQEERAKIQKDFDKARRWYIGTDLFSIAGLLSSKSPMVNKHDYREATKYGWSSTYVFLERGIRIRLHSDLSVYSTIYREKLGPIKLDIPLSQWWHYQLGK